MMTRVREVITSIIIAAAWYSFALFNYIYLIVLSLYQSGDFGWPTEQDRNKLLLARDEAWNLAKPVSNLRHNFHRLQDGRRLHYLANVQEADRPPKHNLVIFIHGFPDSCQLWREVANSLLLQEKSTIVAVDLPGTGGSESYPNYGATIVLEALTEFVVAMREKYLGEDASHGLSATRVFIIGHDWGGLLGFRLATEAVSGLADRYILINGPHMPLALANKDRIIQSSQKMITTFFHSPRFNRHSLPKAVWALRPLLKQAVASGYVFAFWLPPRMINYLGSFRKSALIRSVHKSQYDFKRRGYDPHQAMANSFGPGIDECRTKTLDREPQTYPESVKARASEEGAWFVHFTAYYRNGVGLGKWDKSLTTVAKFYDIDTESGAGDLPRTSSPTRVQRLSSSSSLSPLLESEESRLKAPATILWGQRDSALTEEICLQGIGEYLYQGSQVIALPDSAHWVPCDKKGQFLLRRILEFLVHEGDIGRDDIQVLAEEAYPRAVVTIAK